MKHLLISLILSLPIFAGNLQLTTGSIKAHAEMMMDSGINPINTKLRASLNIEDEDIQTLSGNFSVDLNLFISDNTDRDEHMCESLESKQFKLARYTITSVEKTDVKDAYIISGKLNFHGTEKELKANANISYKDGVLNLSATSMILMPEYGIEMPCMMFMCVEDKVDLIINASFVK